MVRNKFMTRVFSAIENEESEVLNQIESDLSMAKEDGSLDTEEYSIDYSDGVYTLIDKPNAETTVIKEIPEDQSYYMMDIMDANKAIPEPTSNGISVGMRVIWLDQLGEKHSGIVSEINDGNATVIENATALTVPTDQLQSVTESDETFSGTFKGGKMIVRIGQYDVQLDAKEKVAIVLDEDISFQFDPKQSLEKVISEIESKLKKNGLKKFSSRNFSRMSEKTQKMFFLSQ